MTERFPDILNPVVDSSGDVISGAQLFFYSVGTSTKKNTYSDSAKTVANANPVVADSAGRFGDIFMLTDEQYKVVLAPAADTDPPTSPIDTWDNVSPVLPSGEFPVLSILSKSTNYTVLTTDRGATILVDASSGAVTITLPAVATAASGFSVYVIKIDSSANVVTVDGDASETVNGVTTQALGKQYDAVEPVTDGTAWYLRVKLPDMEKIGISDISSPVSSVDFTWADRAYDVVEFTGYEVSPATDNVDFWLRLSTDGSTFGSGANHGYHGRFDDGAVTRTDASNANQIVLSDTNASNAVDAAAALKFHLRLVCNAQETNSRTYAQGHCTIDYANNGAAHTVGTVAVDAETSSSTASLRGVQFLFSSGNVDDGLIVGYGYRRIQ